MGGRSETEGGVGLTPWPVVALFSVCVGMGFGFVLAEKEEEEARLQMIRGCAAVVVAEVPLFEPDSTQQLRRWRKDLRQALRRFRRVVATSLGWWVAWAPAMIGGFVWILAVGAVDRAIFTRYWERGIGEAGKAFAQGVAVYVRLLRDRATPGVGKALLVAVLLYAGSPRDLIWDTRGLLGFLDDGAFLAIAARSFLRMCPQAQIEAHARKVVQRNRSGKTRRGQKLGHAGIKGGSSITEEV